MFAVPLWGRQEEPEKASAAWQSFQRVAEKNSAWAFWRDWYQGFLDGRPLDWGLQREIALLPDEDWKSAAHIAGKIAEIEARYLRGASAISEIIWFDEAAGHFDARPGDVLAPDVLRRALERVEDALGDAVALGRGQGVHDDGLEARILRRLFERYRDDAQRVEMDFEDVAAIVARQIARSEYPDGEEQQALIRALTVAAAEIRAAFPEVAETRTRLDVQAEPRQLDAQQAEQLERALPELRALTSERLGRGIEEDVRELLGTDIRPVGKVPPLPSPGVRTVTPRKSVVRRLAYRVSSIAVELGKLSATRLRQLDKTLNEHHGAIAVIGILVAILNLL